MEWSWWVSSNNACEPGEQLIVLANSDDESDLVGWSLLLLAATVRSFSYMLLGISEHNKMVLWPGCEGRAEFSLHTKNVRSVWFVVKRRGCCCNFSGGVALIVWFTMNGMCAKNKNIYAWCESIIEWSWWVTSNNACEPGEQFIVLANGDIKSDLIRWSLLLLAATVWSFAHMPLGISDCNSCHSFTISVCVYKSS